MRTVLLDYYIDELTKLFDKPCPPAPEDEMRKCFEEKNYRGMMTLIKMRMGFTAKLKIGWKPPNPIPAEETLSIENLVNTRGVPFERQEFAVFIHRSTVEIAPFEMFATSVANLLASVLLQSKKSSLVGDPAASDVAAMFLGFSNLYLKKEAHASRRVTPKAGGRVNVDYAERGTAGAITEAEARYVAARLAERFGEHGAL